MKTFVCLTAVLAFALSTGAQTAAPAKPPVKIDLDEAAPKAAPPAAARKDDKKKKEEPPAKIDGVAVPRGTGFLGIQVINGTFRVTFYDAKKKPVAPDVAQAVLRWNVKYSLDPERTLLTPGGDAHSLTSEKIVRQPWAFRLTVILLKSETDDANPETFSVDFRQ